MNISRLKFLKFVFKLIFKLHRQEFGNVIYIYIYIYILRFKNIQRLNPKRYIKV